MPHIANAPDLEISAVRRAQSQLSSAAYHRDGSCMRTRGKANGFGDRLRCE
jgi:hypothetical protein